MKFFRLILFLPIAFLCLSLQAQPITVTARLDSTILWIGDQSGLSFEVTQSAEQQVEFPVFYDTISSGLEIVGGIRMDTTKSKDGYLIVRQNYTVTAFEDSLYYVPPFPFVLNGDTVWSNPLSMKVVQPFEIDTASHAITDIKPVYNVKFYWKGFLKWLFFIWLVCAIVLLIWFLVRKFVQKKPVIPFVKEPEVLLPAHVVALAALDKIKQKKSWQQGRVKEYHTELTDVLREYIERLFNVSSMEMTSDEILDSLGMLRVSQKSAHNGLKQILQLADLVKFAKWNPTTEENEISLMNAYLFVNQTKIEEVKPPAEENGKKKENEK